MKMSVLQRFESRYVEDLNAGCWLWRSAQNGAGYGAFYCAGITSLAHRAAWVLFKGVIPEGMDVLHHCDVKRCVNPEHLFLGTQVDNAKDMMNKGRGSFIAQHGENNGRAKLNKKQVLEIRGLVGLRSQRELAVRYNVSRRNIRGILTRKLWKEIAESPEKYRVRATKETP